MLMSTATFAAILVLPVSNLLSPMVLAPDPPPEPKVVDGDNTTACNCYLEVKRIIPNLPLTKDLKPNSPARAGAVAIYLYPDKDGNLTEPHYGYVESVVNQGMYGHFEHGSHLHGCEFYERFVLESSPFLVGYWFPPSSVPVQALVGKSGP